MTFIHTSDWHLGKNLFEFSLLEDQAYFIDFLLGVLSKGGIDAVVIAGDIYDRAVPSGDALRLFDFFLSETVSRMKIPVIAIAGNHDSPGRLEFGKNLYKNSGYYIAGDIKKQLDTVILSDDYGQVCFTLIPYLHPADLRPLYQDQPLTTFDESYRLLLSDNAPPNMRSVAVAHGFFGETGAAQNELVFSDSEVNVGGMDIVDSGCFNKFNYAAFGHLHIPQSHSNASTATAYSGAPLKYSLSEENKEKSISIVSIDGAGAVSSKKIPIPYLRNVRSVIGTLDQLLDPSYHPNKQFNDYVFANVSGSPSLYPMQKLRTLFPRLLGLNFVDLEVKGLDLPTFSAKTDAKTGIEDLFYRFFSEIKGTEITDEQREIVRETLDLIGREEDR